MHVTVLSKGIVLGHAELVPLGDDHPLMFHGELRPSPAYEKVRSICQAPIAIVNQMIGEVDDPHADAPDLPGPDRLLAVGLGMSALQDAVAALEIELVDGSGDVIATDAPVLISDYQAVGNDQPIEVAALLAGGERRRATEL